MTALSHGLVDPLVQGAWPDADVADVHETEME